MPITFALPEAAREAERAISGYFTYWNAGYELANKLLPWVVPGYREDYSQTAAYRRELEKYMGYLPA